jgi:hypothetical protein
MLILSLLDLARSEVKARTAEKLEYCRASLGNLFSGNVPIPAVVSGFESALANPTVQDLE